VAPLVVVVVLVTVGVVGARQDGGLNFAELGPALEVVAELGHHALLPCSLSSPQPGDRPRLVLWFREEEPAKPIYTVDLRDRTLSDARHWSDEAALQGRGFFKMDQDGPGVLLIEGVRAKDRGVYRCRVDFKIQPTTISRVDLAVNMPPEKPVILDSRGREVGPGWAPTGSVRPWSSPALSLEGDPLLRSPGGGRARWSTPHSRGRSPG